MVIGKREKLRHVAAAFVESVRNRPEQPDQAAKWSRGDILIDVRMAQPIPAPSMEPLREE